MLQNANQHFWQIGWRNVNNLVLIIVKWVPSQYRSVVRIEKIFLGKDNVVRVVSVRISSGSCLWLIVNSCPLSFVSTFGFLFFSVLLILNSQMNWWKAYVGYLNLPLSIYTKIPILFLFFYTLWIALQVRWTMCREELLINNSKRNKKVSISYIILF